VPKPLRVRYSRINSEVDALLQKYRIDSPPVPVEEVTREEGIEISFRTLQDSMAGFLLRRGQNKIIGVNDHHAPARRRFTIAHELGHALLHEGEELYVDHSFRVNLRGPEASTATNIEEIEANTFAATLLMPRRMLLRDLQSWGFDLEDDEQLNELAHDYGVSRSAMSFRLMNLLSRT
jgi:Zn-dependent peptidase ImmA (M78 family)